MDSIFRVLAIYGFVWLIFRISGKRSLSQITTFDFVLLLIISETTQQALIGKDESMTAALLMISTFFLIELSLSLAKRFLPATDKFIDSLPLLILVDGQPIEEHLKKERVTVDDILEAGRKYQGLERLDQMRYAVLECSGEITVVPRREVDAG